MILPNRSNQAREDKLGACVPVRPPVPLPPARLASLPSCPECCRCSCKSHPNTRSLEQPFFFTFCRDFMARAPRIWPHHFCSPRPLTYQSPMESQSVVGFGPALEGQGSKLEVEGGLGNGSSTCLWGPLGPHGSGYGRGSYQNLGMKLYLVAKLSPGPLSHCEALGGRKLCSSSNPLPVRASLQPQGLRWGR